MNCKKNAKSRSDDEYRLFDPAVEKVIVSRFFRKNKSGHLVAGSQPAMISDSRSSSAFKR